MVWKARRTNSFCISCSCVLRFTHFLTNILSYSNPHNFFSFLHFHNHFKAASLTHSFIYVHTHWFTFSCIPTLTLCLIYSYTHSLLHTQIHSPCSVNTLTNQLSFIIHVVTNSPFTAAGTAGVVLEEDPTQHQDEHWHQGYSWVDQRTSWVLVHRGLWKVLSDGWMMPRSGWMVWRNKWTVLRDEWTMLRGEWTMLRGGWTDKKTGENMVVNEWHKLISLVVNADVKEFFMWRWDRFIDGKMVNNYY